MTEFIGKPANVVIDLDEQYRLTYELTGGFFGFDSSLNAYGIESRLYEVLPQIGLIPRSMPQATTGDKVIVMRVQPSDLMQGLTVGQMANRADLSSFDFTLGFNFALGVNLDLTRVEYVGEIGSGSNLPSGTGSIPSDSEAKDDANRDAEAGDLASRIIRAMQGVGLIVLVVGIAYLYTQRQR